MTIQKRIFGIVVVVYCLSLSMLEGMAFRLPSFKKKKNADTLYVFISKDNEKMSHIIQELYEDVFEAIIRDEKSDTYEGTCAEELYKILQACNAYKCNDGSGNMVISQNPYYQFFLYLQYLLRAKIMNNQEREHELFRKRAATLMHLCGLFTEFIFDSKLSRKDSFEKGPKRLQSQSASKGISPLTWSSEKIAGLIPTLDACEKNISDILEKISEKMGANENNRVLQQRITAWSIKE